MEGREFVMGPAVNLPRSNRSSAIKPAPRTVHTHHPPRAGLCYIDKHIYCLRTGRCASETGIEKYDTHEVEYKGRRNRCIFTACCNIYIENNNNIKEMFSREDQRRTQKNTINRNNRNEERKRVI